MITPSISLCNFARMSEIPQQASFFETKTLGPQRHLLKWLGSMGQAQVEPSIDKKLGIVERTLDKQSGWDPVLTGNHQLSKSLHAIKFHLFVHPVLLPLSFLPVTLQITSTSRLPRYLDQSVRTISCCVPAGLTIGQLCLAGKRQESIWQQKRTAICFLWQYFLQSTIAWT